MASYRGAGMVKPPRLGSASGAPRSAPRRPAAPMPKAMPRPAVGMKRPVMPKMPTR